MKYTKLGHTGLDVSRICLGTMGFGRPESGMFPWAIDAQKSEKVVAKALELGINFLTLPIFILTVTANVILELH